MSQSKPIYQSKKFVAAMSWNLLWLFIIWYGIRANLEPDVLIAMVYASGATQTLYLGGQSAVDAFVRAAKAKYKSVQNTNHKSAD
tara:strand:+ start:213 stop:467 length:255 start_codon:yes stop_codon:yes gene_type:complete